MTVYVFILKKLAEETIAKGVEDPFSVVLKSSKLPMSLLRA